MSATADETFRMEAAEIARLVPELVAETGRLATQNVLDFYVHTGIVFMGSHMLTGPTVDISLESATAALGDGSYLFSAEPARDGGGWAGQCNFAADFAADQPDATRHHLSPIELLRRYGDNLPVLEAVSTTVVGRSPLGGRRGVMADDEYVVPIMAALTTVAGQSVHEAAGDRYVRTNVNVDAGSSGRVYGVASNPAREITQLITMHATSQGRGEIVEVDLLAKPYGTFSHWQMERRLIRRDTQGRLAVVVSRLGLIDGEVVIEHLRGDVNKQTDLVRCESANTDTLAVLGHTLLQYAKGEPMNDEGLL